MTISTTVSRITYVGDGSTVTFSVPFTFFSADEIDVIERNIESSEETVLSLSTHYNVAGGAGAAGTVTALVAPNATKRWTIARRTKRTQMVDYTPNDPFPAETHERALDRLTALVQELDDKLTRALALGPTSSYANLTLPDPSAGRLLGWKSDLTGIENKDLPGGTTVYASVPQTRSGLTVTESVTPYSLASLWRKGADIASTTTLVRPSDNGMGGYHLVTGSASILALWSGEPAGMEIELRFAGALTLVHNPAAIILPGGVNATTTPGDVARFRCEGTDIWRCVSAPPSWFNTGGAGWTLRVSVKNANYTALLTDLGSELQFNTAGTTLSLPAAAVAGNGATLTIRNAASTGSVTIDPDASETLDGQVSRLLRPNDVVAIRCDGVNWRTVSGCYSFESAEQALAMPNMYTVAHTLGEQPTLIRAVFRCKVSDLGWAVGDEVDYCSVLWSYGGALQGDSTNLRASINQTYYPSLANKATGNATSITGSSWRLVLRGVCLKG